MQNNPLSEQAQRIMRGIALINLCEQAHAHGFDMKRAQRLLDDGADLSVKGDKNNTPLLHMAIRARLEDFALKLIQYGAPLDATDEQGYTALHIAVMIPNLKITKALCDAGADIYAIANNNHSAMSLVIGFRILNNEKLLKENRSGYAQIENFLNNEIEKRHQKKVDDMLSKSIISQKSLPRKKATFKKKKTPKP